MIAQLNQAIVASSRERAPTVAVSFLLLDTIDELDPPQKWLQEDNFKIVLED
jgi:hypothetical protein